MNHDSTHFLSVTGGGAEAEIAGVEEMEVIVGGLDFECLWEARDGEEGGCLEGTEESDDEETVGRGGGGRGVLQHG